ncbi:MAG: hypothetical protein PHZ00_02320, partial [Candidatus Peribacteraceae bacterium]|nr:hypothetical protein [Candidatus Peribacteraceae bacterium]
MEASPVTSRRHISAVLSLCLLGSLLVFGFVLMRSGSPPSVTSRGIPLPFGERGTTIRGQVTDIGTTTDNRTIVDMTFDDDEVSEEFGVNDLTFVFTPVNPASFSAGAPLSAALTSGKRFYGYKYTSRNADSERTAAAQAEIIENQGGISYYADRFPGTFFAPTDVLTDDTSAIAKFIADKSTPDHLLKVSSVADMTLDADSLYLIIAEDGEVPTVPGDTKITVRGLVWCGDGILQDSDEVCDAGSLNGNGCSTTCQVETGWLCFPVDSEDPSSRSVCRSCGDDDLSNDTNVAGTVTQLNQDGTEIVEADRCDDSTVLQYDCNESNVATQAVPSVICSFGCGDGVCLADTRTCGDGDTQPDRNEKCDDKNAVPNDGCTDSHIDQGYICNTDANPSTCAPTCGNGTT